MFSSTGFVSFTSTVADLFVFAAPVVAVVDVTSSDFYFFGVSLRNTFLNAIATGVTITAAKTASGIPCVTDKNTIDPNT